MKILKAFWARICEPLDGYLWRKNIDHPVVRPILRNEILASAFFLLLGAVVYIVFPWLFWFGCGILCMVWVFWSWARFFGDVDPSLYGLTLLRSVFMKFGVRLILLALLLYLLLAIFRAMVSALLAGLVAGAILALYSYARYMKCNP